MSATGDEVVTLSQLKEAYNSIVDKLPSAVTFTSSANTSQNSPSNKLIQLSSVSGDTSLARLSGNTIYILKQANYLLSGNVNLTAFTNDGSISPCKLFVNVGNNEYDIDYANYGGIVGPISLELGVLSPNTFIQFYFGYIDKYADEGFRLTDKGSMFTLKTS